MLPFRNLILIDRNHSTPVYLQIANRLIQLITEGLLQPGSKLPSSRILSEIISVHRKTVVAAYEELLSQDWIASIPRKGVIVSLELPEIKPRTFKAKIKAGVYSGKSAYAFASPVPVNYPSELSGFRLVINDGLPDARIAPIDSLMSEYKVILQHSSKRKAPSPGDAAGSAVLRKELCDFFC